MSQSLYLKYRPQGFESMVGQQHVIDVLRAQLKRNEFSQSYLLYGPRGTGKTSTARLIAKAVNATPGADGVVDRINDPMIQTIQRWDTLDFVEIDAASHTWVDNIREEIIDKAVYPPTSLRKKVYIIDEVHMLSKGAFNALLKIMEEPREYLIFILATTEVHKVPDTIVSRCQTFTFRNLTIDQITMRLEYIAQQENIPYEQEGLQLIAKLSNGAMRDGIKYLEQVSVLGEVSVEMVSKFLGVVSWVVIESLMEALREVDYPLFAKTLDDLVERGTDLQALIKDIFRWLDEHFSLEPALRSPWVSIFQEISSEMRYYPRPELLWKKKVRVALEGGGWDQKSENRAPRNQKVAQSVAPPQAGKVNELLEKNETLLHLEPTPRNEEVDERSINLETRGEVQWGNSNSVSGSLDVVSSGATVTESPHPAGTPLLKGGNDVWSNKIFAGSLEELLSAIADKVEKKMVHGILAKQTTIDSLENGLLTMIVINRLYASSLGKDDTVRYLESIAGAILWSAVKISVVYMSKEDFMAKQLGG